MPFKAKSLEGVAQLEKLLLEKNPALSAAQSEIQSKESLSKYSYSSYYPTLYAVGGWGEVHVDNPYDRDKGVVGYLEGRFNIFNGYRDSIVISQKQNDLQIAKLGYEKLRRDFKVQLIQIASELIYLHKLQDILVSEEKITKEQKQMAGKKVASGLTSSVDNLEFDLREEEIRIQQRQINQQHLSAHQKFIQLIGEDIPDKELHELQFSDLNFLGQFKPYKATENIEVSVSQLLFESAMLEQKSIQGEYMPALDLIYAYGRLTPSEQTPVNFNETNYRLLLSFPLFSGFSTVNKQKSVQAESTARKLTLQQTSLDNLSLYNSLKEKSKELLDLYIINERKLNTSQKYFNLTINEYKRGIKNSPDLVGATERWFSAQKKKPELLKDLEITKAQLENITGPQ
ncbi:MAG: TolC family protein [Bdellovibrio sp.]